MQEASERIAWATARATAQLCRLDGNKLWQVRSECEVFNFRQRLHFVQSVQVAFYPFIVFPGLSLSSPCTVQFAELFTSTLSAPHRPTADQVLGSAAASKWVHVVPSAQCLRRSADGCAPLLDTIVVPRDLRQLNKVRAYRDKGGGQ